MLKGWDFESRMPKWEYKLQQNEAWIEHETKMSKEKLYDLLNTLHECGIIE